MRFIPASLTLALGALHATQGHERDQEIKCLVLSAAKDPHFAGTTTAPIDKRKSVILGAASNSLRLAFGRNDNSPQAEGPAFRVNHRTHRATLLT